MENGDIMKRKKSDILLVEDKEDHAELIQRAFGSQHEQVSLTVAGSLQDARTRIRREFPDLVITDLCLPDGKGTELLALQKETSAFPVVVMTSYGDQEVSVEAMKAGALDYVVKSKVTLTDMPHIAERALREWEHIVQQRRTEQALRESERRFRRLFEQSNDAIFIHTFDGKIVDVNDRACEMLGYSKHDLLKLPVPSLHPEDERDTSRNAFQTTLEKGAVRFEAKFRKADNTLIFVDISSRIVDQEKGLVQGIVRDITDRKQMEIALEKERTSLAQKVKEQTAELRAANAELARAARLKDEFLANMSHELRTPLNTILGMSEALQEEVYGVLNGRQLNALRAVEESGHHLLALINDILDLSRIGAGKMELAITSVDVGPLCQASLQFIKQTALKKRLKISSRFNSNVTTIRADERRLKQILVNLLSNAVKFTPEGGKVGLEVEGDTEHHVVHLTVWDTGIGIPQDSMEQLFQPFVQLDSSLSRRYEGTGLGLSLVYRMVEMHGGSISVESEIGKGSRFTVSLPWKKAGDGEIGRLGDREIRRSGDGENRQRAQPSIANHQLSIINHQSPVVVIAEDNETNLQVLAEYLASRGYRIILAQNGKEAVERTQKGHPDLILMDIQMPEMDGVEAIRQIRADENLKTIPIIAVTALVMPGDREKCLTAGADEYLCKPVSLQKLNEMLEKLLLKEEGEQHDKG